MRTPPKLPPLTSPADKALLTKWKRALHFRLAEPGLAADEMLPDQSRFPGQFLSSRLVVEETLGHVLGIAALKLWRAPAGEPVTVAALCPRWPGLFGLLDDQRIATVDRFISLALNTPQCLPALVARLDAISNEELRQMALLAVRGVSVPSIFDGLDNGPND